MKIFVINIINLFPRGIKGLTLINPFSVQTARNLFLLKNYYLFCLQFVYHSRKQPH
jgi:hypothetical protein